MSNLHEDEAEAFFHQGDAGTYDGGPALSLAPVGMADAVEEDERLKPLTVEQVARRERLKRLVTTVVGTLGAGSVLLFALRITRSESETAGAASLPAVSVQHAPSPVAETPAAVAVRAKVEPAAPPAAAEVPPSVAPAVAEERALAPSPVDTTVAPVSPKVAEPVRHAVPATAAVATRSATFHQPSSERAAPRASIFAPPSRTTSAVSSSQSSSGRGHAPPTAVFPD